MKITGDRPGDGTVTYDKGGWVFWMLLNQMGRERALSGIRPFIEGYQGNPDHPVLQDFLTSMRPFAVVPSEYDAFTHQWFREVVVPEYQLHDAKKTARGESWEVSVRVENVGSGVMPVEIAATRGDRFKKDGSPSSEYQEVRSTVVLGKSDSKAVVLICPFELSTGCRRSASQGLAAPAEKCGGKTLTLGEPQAKLGGPGPRHGWRGQRAEFATGRPQV